MRFKSKRKMFTGKINRGSVWMIMEIAKLTELSDSGAGFNLGMDTDRCPYLVSCLHRKENVYFYPTLDI